jgi:betaine-aldehyde dehydrogenase
MNFTWCGQSCGSTSRAFVHASIHDAVVERVKARIAHFPPGPAGRPGDDDGRDREPPQLERVESYVASALRRRRAAGVRRQAPADPKLARGHFYEPTVFADVKPSMRIAQEEIFGPVLAILRWDDEKRMLDDVNAVPYGLTCSIWTNDLTTAHRAAMAVAAGYVWINEVGKHFLGAPFGGVKQSGSAARNAWTSSCASRRARRGRRHAASGAHAPSPAPPRKR